MPKLTDQLSGPLRMMQVVLWCCLLYDGGLGSYASVFLSLQDSARKIARVAIEAKLELDEEKYVESFRPHLMDVVHAWSSVSVQ